MPHNIDLVFPLKRLSLFTPYHLQFRTSHIKNIFWKPLELAKKLAFAISVFIPKVFLENRINLCSEEMCEGTNESKVKVRYCSRELKESSNIGKSWSSKSKKIYI